MEYPPLLRRLIAKENLASQESAQMFGAIMDGAFTPVQSAGLVVALASKGEHMDEIIGAARAMRDRSLHVEHDFKLCVDVVGTGGDGANTINISTMAALVVAASGVPVAKHGNRAASSICGSADVLEAAGFVVDLAPMLAKHMLEETNFTFMFAPSYHPAMRNVAPVRRELGVRSVFNILGPLTNPARTNAQVVGVTSEALLGVVANVLQAVGVERGAVVCGAHGIDEVVGDAPSAVLSFDETGSRRWDLDPREYDLNVPIRAISGGSIEACRDAFLAILKGELSPRADVVALNAALVLFTIGRLPTLGEALQRTREILLTGAAFETFERAKDVAQRG